MDSRRTYLAAVARQLSGSEWFDARVDGFFGHGGLTWIQVATGHQLLHTAPSILSAGNRAHDEHPPTLCYGGVLLRTASRDYVYTDRDSVKRFVEEFPETWFPKTGG